ncbi:hypothetical protein A1D29_03405 [Pasteurellaceae bacterium Orientalotternb1]|nr:hypothetical protein A1D29_03405 [Pasteurellaceae bacterium Orientalotternb1]
MSGGSSNKPSSSKTGGLSSSSYNRLSTQVANTISNSVLSIAKSPMVSGLSNKKPANPIVSAKLASNAVRLIASTTISASKQPIINTKPEISYHLKSNGLNSIANMFKPENNLNNLSNTLIKPDKNESNNVRKIYLNSDVKENLSNNLNYISTAMDIVGNYSNPESLKTVLYS